MVFAFVWWGKRNFEKHKIATRTSRSIIFRQKPLMGFNQFERNKQAFWHAYVLIAGPNRIVDQSIILSLAYRQTPLYP